MSRRDEIFQARRRLEHAGTDRMFAWLLLAQWLFAIVLALVLSPYQYEGAIREVHLHVWLAVVGGGLLNALPLALIVTRPGWWLTRHVVAFVQMTWSAMLIMLTGGRIETHFHVFGSLAFLAFYRDWKVLPTATLVVVLDHLLRGLTWPTSVYGALDPAWWRFLEHGGWVVFESAGLGYAIVRAEAAARADAANQARLERMRSVVERHVEDRTRELVDSREHFRALVENIEAVSFEYDAVAGRFAYIAPQATRLLDCAKGEVDAEAVEGVIHPDDRTRVAAEIAARLGGGPARPIDCRLVTRAGRLVHVRTFLEPAGRRIRGIALDITQQKKLETELHQAQRLESVGRLAAGIAHEINSPIQYASNNVEFVRDVSIDLTAALASPDGADVELRQIAARIPAALDMAREGLDRVAAIVRSMKSFAHPGGELAPVDLNEAVRSTLTIARNEYKYVADVDTSLGELPPVTCFAGEINQAILNIVINAAHAVGAAAPARGRGRISVETRRDGDDVVIAIRDTGVGIPADIGDKVFEPFFTTKPVGTGTGQGLALAHAAIVDKHRGSLTFDSEVGVGTCFVIRIPIDRDDPAGATRRAA